VSRIGRLPIPIPSGVEVTMDGCRVKAKGPKGKLERDFSPRMRIVKDGQELRVERPTDSKRDKSLHGLTRSLLNNMVQGVSQGFQKTLDIVGVGYRAEVKDSVLHLSLGFSHPVEYPIPQGIDIECPVIIRIVVKGIDKELVGKVAAEIRAFRPPEPYKGKGIRYEGEEVRKKAGKAGRAT
jgi:large subunit ribosomal protein L6